MLPHERSSVEDVLKKYGGKIEGQMGVSDIKNVNYSSSYKKFKAEMAPELGKYERWCRSLGSIVRLKPSQKDEDKIRKELEIAHLDLEPWQSLTLSVMSCVGVFFLGLLISVAIMLIKGSFEAFP